MATSAIYLCLRSPGVPERPGTAQHVDGTEREGMERAGVGPGRAQVNYLDAVEFAAEFKP